MNVNAQANLFDKFHGIRPMSRALSTIRRCSPGQVHGWKTKRQIPRGWMPIILQVARDLEIDVSAEDVIFPFPEDRAVI